MRALSWIIALLLAAALIYLGGYMKIYTAEFADDMVSKDLFAQIEAVAVHYAGEMGEYMEPEGRWVMGGLEVLVGLMLIWPVTRMAGAFLTLVIMLGSIAVHVAGEFVPEEVYADAGVEKFGITVMQNGEASYMLFGLAILMFIGSIVLMRVDSTN